MNRRRRLLEANYQAVRKNVFAFCKALNFRPTAQQRELLEIVQRQVPRQKIAIKSGKGPGKSKVSGVVALWWALKNYGAKVIMTAPTMRQCRDQWLDDVRKTMLEADPWLQGLVKVPSTKAVIAGNPSWGIQVVTATTKEALQGWHNDNLKIVVDEASGMDRGLIQTLVDTQSNEDCAMLMIGNPTNRESYFFDCFNTKRAQWECLTWNAEDTPKSRFFDPKRNEELLEEFGRDSDVYRMAVLGEFPHADPNCVLSSEELEKVVDRKTMVRCAGLSGARQMGLDFARFGGDELTLFRRSGEAIVQWTRMVRVDPNRLVDLAFKWQLDCGWRNEDCWYIPDAGGMGQGVMDRFYQAEKQVLEFHNGSAAVESNKYANKMTEAWFNLARKVRRRKVYLPNDGLLLQQLCTRQYHVNSKGLIILETKDDYKKRGHQSPDRADGLVMAFYDEVVAAANSVRLPTAQRSMHRVGTGHLQ